MEYHIIRFDTLYEAVQWAQFWDEEITGDPQFIPYGGDRFAVVYRAEKRLPKYQTKEKV